MNERRYRCEWLVREGERMCRLRDASADAEVDVAPGFGMNAIRYVLQGKDVILPPPSLATLRETPFRYGIPVLSPPGRLTDGLLHYRGHVYPQPIRSGRHAVHGELGRAAWRVVSWGADEAGGAFLEAEYAYSEDAERFASFPFELAYRVAYRLQDGVLSLEGAVRNEGAGYAPFALGYHPYFVCEREQAALTMPAYAQWRMDREGLAIGRPAATALAARLREGAELGSVEGRLHYFQCRDFGRGRALPYECVLSDRAGERRIRYRVDGQFGVMALYVPPWGEAVSLEPHTCLPDAFHPATDAAVAGAQELAPGARLRFGWRIAVERGGDYFT